MLELPEKYIRCTEILEQQAMPLEDVYHYTNWNGLKGILESQRLWLTDYRYLHDTSEIKQSISLIQGIILKASKGGNFALFWNDIFFDIKNFISTHLEFFIFSFCARRNYLSAWRNYANDAAGFSIGFRKEFFKGVEQLQGNKFPKFGRTKIYYDESELSGIIRDLASIVEYDLTKSNALSNSAIAVTSRKEIAYYFLSTIIPFLGSIKHEAYDVEKEHRIYALMDKDCNAQRFFTPGDNFDEPHLNSKPRIYFEFELKHISEIWVGPRLSFDHAKHSINQLLDTLKSKGHDVSEIQICQSIIPYKNS